MSEQIFRVDSVQIAISKSYPPQLFVNAMGTVTTSGWKAAILSLRMYAHPPEDGIQDIDFLATPPAGSALQVLLPITADTSFELVSWVKGIRVHSKSNAEEVLTSDKTRFVEFAES